MLVVYLKHLKYLVVLVFFLLTMVKLDFLNLYFFDKTVKLF